MPGLSRNSFTSLSWRFLEIHTLWDLKMCPPPGNFWLVVSIPLKNISHNGNLPQAGVKNKKYLKPPPRFIWKVKIQQIEKETHLNQTSICCHHESSKKTALYTHLPWIHMTFHLKPSPHHTLLDLLHLCRLVTVGAIGPGGNLHHFVVS